MDEKDYREWIDRASFEELLRRWRFAPMGDDHIFQGEIGKYYGEVMSKRRAELPEGEAVRISKSIGF